MRILQSASLLLLSLCLCASCARTEGHMEVIDQESGGPGYAPKPKPAPQHQAPAATSAPAAQQASKAGPQVHQPAPAVKAQAGQPHQAKPAPQAAKTPASVPAKAQAPAKQPAAQAHAHLEERFLAVVFVFPVVVVKEVADGFNNGFGFHGVRCLSRGWWLG